jgi:hypothetical protein|tara:strand:+ start:8215 stop:8322 length:108 start_codon:yes stop_codon:yes gene_type:complete
MDVLAQLRIVSEPKVEISVANVDSKNFTLSRIANL